jgi:hypothetical protein
MNTSQVTMRMLLSVPLLLVSACTSPERTDLQGSWERLDSNGNVLERMSFDTHGKFTATATRSGATNETRADDWRDLRDTAGSYLVSGDMVMLRGTTADNIRYDVDFTFHVDDAVFVRGAFVEYEHDRTTDLVRHFRAHHSAVYGGMHDIGHARVLDADLQLTGIGDGQYGVAFDDPALGGSDGDGGEWRATTDGGLILERNATAMRYEALGDGSVIGKFDTSAGSMDAPANVWDTAFIFTRAE